MRKTKYSIWITSLLVIMIASLASACAAPPQATTSSPSIAPQATSPAAPATSATATSATASATQIPGNGSSSGGIVYQIVSDQSEARYRVREQLANVSLPSDAIGRTKKISGSIEVKPDGTIDSNSSKITVDISTLQSDRSMRDGFVGRAVLHTSQYPDAVFVPTQVSGLPSPLPQSGNVSFKLAGNLTVQDVTKPVTWDVTGAVLDGGNQAKGTATTSFTFEDFNLTQPKVPLVLSIVDHITLEVDVTLQRQGGAASSGSTTAGTAAIPVSGASPTSGAGANAQAPAACTSPAALTPAVTEGPYFKSGSPTESNLVQPNMTGTKLTLMGYVLTTDCQPVANATLDFWQADAQGQYDNSGYTLRGHQVTDANGRYQLETVVPGLYPGRTEHIHVKVQPQNGTVLTTQLFFPGVTQNQEDQIFDQHLLVQVQSSSAGSETATFNFVVQK